MAITRLNQMAIPEKTFSPMNSNAFDQVDLKFDGFEVETLKDKAKNEIGSFIERLRDFATVIASVKDAGIKSTHLNDAISDFRGRVNECANTIDTISRDFDKKVKERLEQMNLAEKAAYQAAGGVGKFAEASGQGLVNFMDNAASAVADRSNQLKNWAKSRKNATSGIFISSVGTTTPGPSAPSASNASAPMDAPVNTVPTNAYNVWAGSVTSSNV